MKYDTDEIDDIKSKVSITDLLTQHGVKVRSRMCLCPFHNERNPSCQVFEREGRVYCHVCGKGGDHIDLLKVWRGMSFQDALRFLGGERRELTFDERKAIRNRRVEQDSEAKAREDKKVADAVKLFERGAEIKGTLAATYLKNRGITVSKRMWGDLRFIDKLAFWGFGDRSADERVNLGEFPALLAAIRNPETGAQIGTHRTFLDPETGLKLKPPGDQQRNRAKKIAGKSEGGWILLSPPAPSLVLGEGIETALSGGEFGIGGKDAAVAAGVSIYNICGSSLDTIPHPRNKDRRIPNGVPDPDKPGLRPAPWVTKCIILGDSDSEPIWTRAMLATAAQRLQDWLIEASVAMAPEKLDWNDVLQREMQL